MPRNVFRKALPRLREDTCFSVILAANHGSRGCLDFVALDAPTRDVWTRSLRLLILRSIDSSGLGEMGSALVAGASEPLLGSRGNKHAETAEARKI